MLLRKLYRVAVPAATAALTLAAGIAPSQAAGAKRWPIVDTVGAASDRTLLSSVVASSATNAWAAGVDCPSPCMTSPVTGQLLVEQWNGAQWQPATMPTTPAPLPAVLFDTPAIGSSSPTNTWVFAADGNGNPLAVRWDGQQWTEQTLPSWFFSNGAGTLGQLQAEVLSPTNVWVFSDPALIATSLNAGLATFAAHYNGSTWSKVRLRGVPTGESAVSASSLWTVVVKGTGAAGVRASRPGVAGAEQAAARYAARIAASAKAVEVAKRWTRRGWRNVRMPSPYLGKGRVFLPLAAAGAGARSLWVNGVVMKVTRTSLSLKESQLLHWNGRKWTRAVVPVKHAVDAFATMTQDGKGGVWQDMAVGFTTNAAPGTILAHYRKGRWTTQLPPKYQHVRTAVAGLAWIPGTTSDWGVGMTSLSTPSALGMIVKHGK